MRHGPDEQSWIDMAPAGREFGADFVPVTPYRPEPPCIGLHPDTYQCPFCGATLDEPCGREVSKQ